MRSLGTKYPILDFFPNLDKVEAVRRVFGSRTDEILRNLKIEFTGIGRYMWVNTTDGHLMVDSNYLKDGNRLDIYLDIIHELVHVRQYMEGRELFDRNYNYVDRPTEIEAYQHTVKEARRLGLNDERICEYLKTEWMSEKDFRRLANALRVKFEEKELSPIITTSC